MWVQAWMVVLVVLQLQHQVQSQQQLQGCSSSK
jgi:hypothetical protein